MFSLVGYGRYDNMGCVCYSLIALGLLLLVSSAGYAVFVSASYVALGLAVGGVAAWLIGWLILQRMHWLVKQYNPNEERLDERKRIAKARAFLLPEFDAIQATRVGGSYYQYRKSPTRSDRRKPLVTEWWLPPSIFVNGGTFSFVVLDDERFTVQVPDDAEPGDVVDARPDNPDSEPFRLRLLAMRAHPDEQRLE
jgi:hypothetical protein